MRERGLIVGGAAASGKSLTVGLLDTSQQIWRRTLLKMAGARLGTGVRCGRRLDVSLGMADGLPGRLLLGDQTELETGVLIRCYGGVLTTGPRVHVGPYSVIYAHGGIDIGEDSLIGPGCTLIAADHGIPSCDRRIRWEPDIREPIRIGRDVWLGSNVTVLRGVTIGDGAVVGAGALVRNDVAAGAIVVGNPARVIRHRDATSGGAPVDDSGHPAPDRRRLETARGQD